jgi:hypothetical protein
VRNGGTALLPALLHPAVELVEAGKRACLEDLLLELAVVADHAIERLEREVPAVGDVEHANALHVVRKEAAGAGMVDVVQEALACVAKGRVANVVAKRDRLDEVEVEAEGSANVSAPRARRAARAGRGGPSRRSARNEKTWVFPARRLYADMCIIFSASRTKAGRKTLSWSRSVLSRRSAAALGVANGERTPLARRSAMACCTWGESCPVR